MFKNILAANDGSENAFEALDVAADLARRLQADLHVVLVEELTPQSGTIADVQLRKAADDRLAARQRKRIQDAAARAEITLATHVFVGHPVQTIVSFAKDNAFDLLVLGATGHSTFYEQLIGARAGHIAHLAPCTVMIVKNGGTP